MLYWGKELDMLSRREQLVKKDAETSSHPIAIYELLALLYVYPLTESKRVPVALFLDHLG